MDIGLILAAASTDPTWLQSLGGWAWSIFCVVAGLTFVIFVHELGHFLVAKACGVKCEKFYVGFDFLEFKLGPIKIPRALIKFQWGETEYGVGSLPLGGYVKMLGQDDDPRNAEAEAARTRIAQEGTAAAEGTPPGQAVEATTTEGQKILLDPRSYPAKSVPARMAIISAGVIMNVIFGVILAAMAFGLGVEEMPAVVGEVAPATPAWNAGVEPGSQILALRKGAEPDKQLRFMDLKAAVMLNGYHRDMSLLLRAPNGQEEWYHIRPSDRVKSETKMPQVGIGPAMDLKIGESPEELAHLGPKSSIELLDNDKIVSVNGQKVATGVELNAVLAQQPLGPIDLVLERKPSKEKDPEQKQAPKRLEARIEAKPYRELGAVMRIGEVVAVQAASPAEKAGFQVKDTIVEVRGEPVGDPLSLSQRLIAAGNDEPIEFVVLRRSADGKESRQTLTVEPRLPQQFHERFWAGGPTSLESIGLAYDVTSVVESVLPGSPAEQAGLKPGDIVTRIEFVPGKDAAAAKQLDGKLDVKVHEPIDVDDKLKSWTYVHTRFQLILPESEVTVHWTRGGKAMSQTMMPRDSETFFDESRGLPLYPLSVLREAHSFGEAMTLGLREMRGRLGEVLLILQSLATGNLSLTNLSGPAGILYVAGKSAQGGTATFLLFLTMLSANLAILNFLPIPALDGGHMLFLAAEGIRGKPVDERLQVRLTILGVICLLSLMVFATAMDLGRFAEMFM